MSQKSPEAVSEYQIFERFLGGGGGHFRNVNAKQMQMKNFPHPPAISSDFTSQALAFDYCRVLKSPDAAEKFLCMHCDFSMQISTAVEA